MYIQLDSQVLYYEHSGEGEKSLLLLHGNGEGHSIFDELTAELFAEFDIYAIDSRGHGLSATPKEYHYADMARDVINFITALSIPHPTILGFSDGGIVALIAAMEYPEIAGVIACGANASPEGLTFSAKRQIKKEFRANQSPLTELMLKEPHLMEADFANITCPVLYLGGEKDMISEKEFKKMKGWTKNASITILKGEDHGSYVEHSTALAPYIREFIH